MAHEQINDHDAVKQLVYLYHFHKPTMTAKRIFVMWTKSKVFLDYERPTLEILIEWIQEFDNEL